MALYEPLHIPQGKSWVGPFWALLGEDGSPKDLTGRAVRAQVRPSVHDSTVLHEWSTAAGNVQVATATVTIDDANGATTQVTTKAIALAVTPTVSSAWTWHDGVYDVEVYSLTDPDDVWSVVDCSPVDLGFEVTR